MASRSGAWQYPRVHAYSTVREKNGRQAVCALCNTSGLFADILGACLLFFFGPPPSVFLSEGRELLWTQSKEPGAAARAKGRTRLGRIGLLLLIVGFALQVIGNLAR
jgi:hypothetical protein